MKSRSYYPPGTVCYKDPSAATCVRFGNSGSGVLRKFDTIDGTDRYSWIGPLSMSKGCDITWTYQKSIIFASQNPNVFTDGYCYLDWIAKQYGMEMPPDYVKPAYCSMSTGSKD